MANLNKTNYNIENLLNLNIDLAKGIHLGATAGVTYDGHTFLNKNVKGTRFSNFDLRTKGLHLASDGLTSLPSLWPGVWSRKSL